MDPICKLFSSSIYFSQQYSPHPILSVEGSPLVGNTFTQYCKDWKVGTYENFVDWAGKQFGTKELESDDNAEVPVDMQKAKDIVFERNDWGEFILPPMEDFRTTKQKQRIIRGYIGAVYRLCLR